MSELWPKSTPAELSSPLLEERVESLLSGMSLEQKVGQMIQADIRYITPAQVGQYQIGSILSGGGATPDSNLRADIADWLALADAYHEASKSSGSVLPPIWGIDAVHGHNNVYGATIFPHNIGLGAMSNPGLIKEIAAATATEIRVTGLDWNFAPTLAVARDDRWGRTYESYGEIQDLVSSYAKDFVEGMQGSLTDGSFLSDAKVLATAKHFVGDGGTQGGEDQGNTRCDELELYRTHGKSYGLAINAGVQSVMASFNSWHGEKLHGHKYLLTEILKLRMGFDGVIVGDWNGHGQLPDGSNEDAAQAVAAGLDIIMVPEDWHAVFENLIRKVSAGEVPLSRIDDAVRRILRMKLRYGVSFDVKPSDRALSGRHDLVGCEAHRKIAQQAVRESAVLLKNEANVLPIGPGKKVLLVGSAADNIAQQCGGWSLSWQGDGVTNDDFPGATSIHKAIEQAVEETQGSLLTDLSVAQQADLAIVVFGEQPYAEGEGDLAYLSYSAHQSEGLELLTRLKKLGIPTVSIFLSGRPLWVNPELNASDAFVAAWLPGSEATGLADLLFGHRGYDFSGRLSFSWPNHPDQSPLNIGDANYEPLFAMGYGLDLNRQSQLGMLAEVDPYARSGNEDQVAVFERRPLGPYRLYAGDEADWFGLVDRARFKSRSGVVEVATVDWQRQEDARRVTWRGGSGQFLIASEQGRDVSSNFGSGGCLILQLCLHQKPSSSVVLRMDSEFPKSASLDLTDTLHQLPLGEWTQLEFSLHQFEQQNFDVSNLTCPLLIWTDGLLSLSVGFVKLVAPGYQLAAEM